MRIGHEIGVAEKRHLELICSEFDEVKFRTDSKNHYQLFQQLVELSTKIDSRTPQNIMRARQSFTEAQTRNAFLIKLKIHGSVWIHHNMPLYYQRRL